jgi:hypothetical protein
MKVCIILHNMIIEDEKDGDLPPVHNTEWPGIVDPPVSDIADLIDAHTYIQNKQTSHQLRTDLVEHIWSMKGHGSGGN